MTPKPEENKGDTGARGAKGDKGERGEPGIPEPRRKLKSYEHSFEAVPAVVVADKTDKFGKRLGLFALILLILGFVIAGYIQSAKNGRDLQKPIKVPAPKVTVSVVPKPPASITNDIPKPTPSPTILVIYSQGPAGRDGADGASGRNGTSPNQPNPSPRPTASPSASPSPSNTPNPVASVVCTVINCPRSDNAKPRTHSK